MAITDDSGILVAIKDAVLKSRSSGYRLGYFIVFHFSWIL
jgi:hypothetical protein